MQFSSLVTAARSGALSRRDFLAASAALGVGAGDALAELPARLHSLPAHLRRIWERPQRVVVGVDPGQPIPAVRYEPDSVELHMPPGVRVWRRGQARIVVLGP